MKLRNVIKRSLQTYKKYRDENLTTSTPFKGLVYNIRRSHGRNNSGKITVRHHFSGHKKLYRDVSLRRKVLDTVGTIMTVEYCPYRTAWISLIKYDDKSHEYVLHTVGMSVGGSVIASKNAVPVTSGNATMLKNIPAGTVVCSVETRQNSGGKLARSAGTYAEVVDHVGEYTIIKIPSGSMLKVKSNCTATIGQISNIYHKNRVMYKAGQNYHKGNRPTVRGVAMNPVDHPHGGGEGKTGTKRHPVSYSNQLAKGKKTANKKRPQRRFILKARKKKN